MQNLLTIIGIRCFMRYESIAKVEIDFAKKVAASVALCWSAFNG